MDLMPAKKLGFGLMRMPQLDPNDGASVDVEQVKQKLLTLAYIREELAKE